MVCSRRRINICVFGHPPYRGNKDVTDYLNFARALSSLILSVVTIGMSIAGNLDLTRNFSRLIDAGHATETASIRLVTSSDLVREHVQAILHQVGAIDQKPDSRNASVQIASTIERPAQGQPPMPGLLSRTSPHGLVILFALKSIESKEIVLSLIFAAATELNAQYIQGYMVATLSFDIIAWQTSGGGYKIVAIPGTTKEDIERKIRGVIEAQKIAGLEHNLLEQIFEKTQRYIEGLIHEARAT